MVKSQESEMRKTANHRSSPRKDAFLCRAGEHGSTHPAHAAVRLRSELLTHPSERDSKRSTHIAEPFVFFVRVAGWRSATENTATHSQLDIVLVKFVGGVGRRLQEASKEATENIRGGPGPEGEIGTPPVG